MYGHYNNDPRQPQAQGGYPNNQPPHHSHAAPYGYDAYGHPLPQPPPQSGGYSHQPAPPHHYNGYDHNIPTEYLNHNPPPPSYHNHPPPQQQVYYHGNPTPPPQGQHGHLQQPPPPMVSSGPGGGGNGGEHRGPGILTPHDHDVLCGRGGATNNHIGNTNYRKLVSHNKRLYITCPKRHKIIVSKSIVEAVRRQNPPGRFLIKEADGLWHDIGHSKALEKTSQALREGANEIRKAMEDESRSGRTTTESSKSRKRPEAVVSNGKSGKAKTSVDLSKTESEDDSQTMPPPPNVRRSIIRKDKDDMSTTSRSKKDRVVWDEDSINTGKSKSKNTDGLNDGERDALARLNRVSSGRSRDKSHSSTTGDDSSAYEPTPIGSGSSIKDGMGNDILSVPSISLSDIGMSLGSFGMASYRSGSKNGTFTEDDMSIALINEAVLGSSRSIGMNSVELPSLGSSSRDWSKAKNAMSYDELSQMMEESIKSFQSLGFDGRSRDGSL